MRCEAVRFAAAVVVALAVAGTAAAAGRARVRVPESHLELEAKDGDLVIRKGSTRARLPMQSLDPTLYPDMPLNLEVRTKGDDVTATIETNCQGKSTLTFTRATLEARLEMAAAEAHAALRRWDLASVGFARAAKLDPDLAEAATSLAVAQAKAGRSRDAVATLVSAAARHRVWVIWRAIVDGSLAQAAADPEVLKLSARTRGHASRRALKDAHAAYSTDLGVVVWDRDYRNSMSEDGQEPSELRVVDAITGKLVARLPYLGVSPRAVDQALGAMGFETGAVKARDLGGVGPGSGAGFKSFQGQVPGSRVSVVVNEARVRLTEGARLVGEAVIAAHSDFPSAGAWVASVPGGVLVGVDVNVGDACGAWGYDDVVWMRGGAQGRQ